MLASRLWPHVTFYKQQREIIRSVADNDETYVPAGNMLGKDFVSGFVVLWFFLTRYPCRIITTSAKDDHLRVLWGEIGRYIQDSKFPLTADKGGPLIHNHREIRRVYNGKECKLSYVKGMVAAPDSIAAMQGHHIAKTGDRIPRTLFVSDESSSVRDEYMTMATTWANRVLVIGNTWPCENFFKRGVKAGDDPRPDGGYYRKVIRIRAEDSPNVRLALWQISQGMKPTGEMVIPGAKDWDEYCKNRRNWDTVQQTVSLDAEFYEGPEEKLFPVDWLNASHDAADNLRGLPRRAKAVGIDPAEGGDKTAMAAVDELGLVALTSRKTPNTADVTNEAIAFAREHGVEDNRWVFDRGGGGKQHADRLRQQGFKGVRTVAFGSSPQLELRRGTHTLDTRRDHKEEQYVYKNMRSQLYWRLRLFLEKGWAIPRQYKNLRDELVPIPKTYDSEGRCTLLPKHGKDDKDKECLVSLIGHSPDEADAVVLALHGMVHKGIKSKAGVA